MSWLQEPMEPIPEEGDGEEWPVVPSSSGGRRTTRKREVFTSEQVDTLVSTVPKDTVPEDWVVENEVVVDPEMATSYVTEALAGPHSARGSTYSYTYESHYDNPPEEDEIVDSNVHQTHRVTRVTKVTTTRSVRQIPVGSPYGDLYFDSSGLPTPSPVVEIDAPYDELGIQLHTELEDRIAPPPAPAPGGRYGSPPGEPGMPTAPDIVNMGVGEVTLSWSAPLFKPGGINVQGYQIEMRELPNGEWERAHENLLTDTICTITNLELGSEVQFRVSAFGNDTFGPPSSCSVPVQVPFDQSASGSSVAGLPPAPGKPVVTGIDGTRATIEWVPPVIDTHSSSVSGYQVEYRTFGTVDWMIANDSLISGHRYTIDNLRPNGVYEFRVRAKNADGYGHPSKSTGAVHIKPEAPRRGLPSRSITDELPPPGQPQLVEADMDWVKLEWAESAPGVGYIVEFREVGDPNWFTANQHPIPQNCIHVEGLRPGSTYEFRVVSVSGAEASEPSEVSNIISLRMRWNPEASSRGVPNRPCAPEYLEVEGDRITICWLPAQSTLPVIGYDVEFRDFQQDNGWYKVNDQPVRACKMTVGDLIIGHEYQFRVIAQNSIGSSEPSDASPPLTIKPLEFGDVKFVEAERFGAVPLLQDELSRESPPLPERDDSPPPLRRGQNNGTLQWRDPSLKEVIEYLDSHDREKQINASGYLQHLTFNDKFIKDETREYGGIPKLIGLLRSDVPTIQRNCCACLKNLSFGKENEKNKVVILENDGVRLLAALLQTTHEQSIKEEATAVLWNLSSSDQLKPVILAVATDALVQQTVVPGAIFHSNGLSAGQQDLTKHYTTPIFKNSTGVLRNISAASATARQRLRQCPGLIEGLVHFLSVAIQRVQVDSQAVENVICLLRNLSYRVQEVVDPNYDPSRPTQTSSKSKLAPLSPKPKKKDKDKTSAKEQVSGPAVLWQPHVVRLYLKLLQEASNLDTLEASAGALQNLAACQFQPSADVRTAVRVEKGLPVLVELIRLKEDYVVCAVATALRNLSLDSRNRDLIGKYALKDLIEKLPEPGRPRPDISDQTIGAVLGILFEIVKHSVNFTRDVHECKGTDKLRHLARSYPTYSQRVCRYASQVLYMMWQHKELHDGFKRSGLKEVDFYSGSAKRNDHSATLARPISSQGRERPAQALLDDTTSSGGYGAVTDYGRPIPSPRTTTVTPSGRAPEPLYASVRKGQRNAADDSSWV